MKQNVSVIGLGKLGSPLAAVLACKGHSVIGVDLNDRFVQAVNDGKAPVFEPGLDELIGQVTERLHATTDYEKAVLHTDISFIIVPTPTEDGGGFSLGYVLAAAKSIGEILRRKDSFHLVVVTSTVMPGDTENEVLPALEASSGKQCGLDFGLCYNPEFIALGSVIRDMLEPDAILIGESDPRSGEMLAQVYQTLCDNNPPITCMNLVNAELTKIAVNTFVTTKISYANMLSQVCEGLPGADVDVVTGALGLDTRIGRKYLKGALGYGGPCFPRDNIAFAYVARQVGTRAILAEATDEVNRQQIPRLGERVLSALPNGGTVGILGLSYKPNTDVVEKSQGILLARYLRDRQVPLVLYDPAAIVNARQALGEQNIHFARSAAECLELACTIVVTTPWPEFRNLDPNWLNSDNGFPTAIDCWRILDRERFKTVANYIALGIGTNPHIA